jgi:hypothetical protein
VSVSWLGRDSIVVGTEKPVSNGMGILRFESVCTYRKS